MPSQDPSARSEQHDARAGLHFVLGGVRSGKSAFAEDAARKRAAGARLVYIATAEPIDDDMRTRITSHVDRRGPAWHTVEAPVEVPQALQATARADAVVLIDCLSVWLGNLMHYDLDVAAHTDMLIECLPRLAGPAIFVASEVGLGIMPDNAMGRRFADLAGSLNQRLAAECDAVTLVVAGTPLRIK